MKVLDLACSEGHVFEGWFGSEQDFSSQLARSLITCPVCGHSDVHKRLSAPRLNLGRGRQPESAAEIQGENGPASSASTSAPTEEPNAAQLQAAWLSAARRLLAHTEDVGTQFAAEARKMHYGDAPERSIRGQATVQDAVDLMEEGIDVLPVTLPEGLKNTLQ